MLHISKLNMIGLGSNHHAESLTAAICESNCTTYGNVFEPLYVLLLLS